MRTRWVVGLAVGALAVFPATMAQTAEHGGKEHGGTATAPAAKEHGGATQEHGRQPVAQVEPSAEQLRQAIRDHVTMTIQEQGAFTIADAATGSTRTLSLIRVHDRVGKTGNYYYSCTDMRDAASGETLDLDFDIQAQGGTTGVVDVRIHKVNGQARYTYDDQDNRIPLM